MKTIAIMGMVALIVGGIVLSNRSAVEYEAPETVTEVVTEEVDALNKAVEDAIKASSTDITNAAQAAYDDTVEQMHRKIELEVRREYRERLEGEIEALEKVTGEYWRDRENIVRLIKQTFPEHPHLFVTIAKGESGLKQWHTNGKVVRGIKDPDDTGLFQINNRYWSKEAERLGLDYENSIEDNVAMARHVYDTQGITAWVYYNDHIAMR